ncbi:transglutaminaseTgpA domain-containing protein [Acinetobacter venetianus]|jgi:transglutaminase-like putative cysteine protease|uniref:transglutaminase family protein n=1 Tax=Acinetobacter venetianus TaxID=52133 RepID=UPI00384ED75A
MTKQIYFCVLSTLALVLLGQVAFAPITLSGVWGFIWLILVWRYNKQVITPFPKLILILFSLLSLGLIYINYQTLLGVEAGVAFLSTCLFAKSLEAKNTRDLLIVFNFALFVSASLLLHSQAFWMAVIVLLTFLMCLLGLYRIQTAAFSQSQLSSGQLKQDLKQIVKFVGIATPFFILLFIFFPRLPPLWAIPIQKDRATTGISDTMSPGDIAQLSQSSALAFRVIADMYQFPTRQQLYWRALVLDQYDGRTWTSSFFNQQLKTASSASRFVDYKYLPADEQSNWIMGLEYSIPQERYLQLYQDDSIRPSKLIKRNQPIQMQWLGRTTSEPTVLSTKQFELNTQYDKTQDQEAQQLAHQLFEQSQNQPEEYIQTVLKWYRKNGFVYTLTPGTLGGDRIDQFLFSSRKGFCEHYASSFVMLMRFVGIPARVVTGYQGGQLAIDGQSWEVRQLDAHAWSEVYIDGKWKRIDPTAMIAPQRIDTGMQDYLAQDQTVWGDERAQGWRLQQFKFLKNVRIWSDYLSYQWQSKVVGYDVEKQKNWLSRLGLDSTYGYVIILIVGIGGVLLFYVGFYWWRQRQQLLEYQRLIFNFQKQLPTPMHKRQAETFQTWMQRLMNSVEDHKSFEQVIVLYQKIVFMESNSPSDKQLFKKLLKDCAIAIKRSQKNL